MKEEGYLDIYAQMIDNSLGCFILVFLLFSKINKKEESMYVITIIGGGIIVLFLLYSHHAGATIPHTSTSVWNVAQNIPNCIYINREINHQMKKEKERIINYQ